MNWVEQRFVGEASIVERGTMLFSADVSQRVLDFCAIEKIDVLGVDGFVMDGDKRMSPLDLLLDLSSILLHLTINERCEIAKMFIRNRAAKDRLFEISLRL